MVDNAIHTAKMPKTQIALFIKSEIAHITYVHECKLSILITRK